MNYDNPMEKQCTFVPLNCSSFHTINKSLTLRGHLHMLLGECFLSNLKRLFMLGDSLLHLLKQIRTLPKTLENF